MAISGAAPGSPYQPLLTPGGHPRGPLTEIATRLHLDAIPGDPILFVGVVVSIVAVLGFLALLRATFRGQVGLGAVAALVIGAHALLLWLPLLFSRDVYSYAYYGRIAGWYGGNTRAVYGPAWSALSSGLSTSLRARPATQVDAYRMVAIVASLATCVLIV